MSTAAGLITAHPDRWHAATCAPFLDAAGDGSLPAAAFDRWLEQDHRFVIALVRSWGLLLQTAPREDLDLLTGGMAAFVDEVGWFEEIATERGLDLDVDPLPAAAAYEAALDELARLPYAEAITAMWAVEAAYLQAWDRVAPGAPAFTAYITHWANDEFAGFVAALAEIVDRELPDGPTAGATEAFRRVADLEARFWTMTTEG
jgi:formylaminopyrimidine deformylase / aminopyrimidine aminohydrolase